MTSVSCIVYFCTWFSMYTYCILDDDDDDDYQYILYNKYIRGTVPLTRHHCKNNLFLKVIKG